MYMFEKRVKLVRTIARKKDKGRETSRRTKHVRDKQRDKENISDKCPLNEKNLSFPTCAKDVVLSSWAKRKRKWRMQKIGSCVDFTIPDWR
jgi:hypothetical protein